jgi:hypothetical protein
VIVAPPHISKLSRAFKKVTAYRGGLSEIVSAAAAVGQFLEWFILEVSSLK